jgi:hypothetical protein
MWTLRGFVIVALVACSEVRTVNAIVIYSEDFEGMTVDVGIPIDPGNIGFGFVVANSSSTDDNKMIVRSPTSPEGQGITAANRGWSGSNFGEWHDNTIDGTSGLLVAQFEPLSASPVKISFDYFEPSGFPATGGNPSGIGNILAFVTGNTNSLHTTGQRSINLIFGDPDTSSTEQFQTNPPATEGVLNNLATLDAKHTLEFFGNLGTGDTLTYKSGAETIANNTYDVWLDGTRIFDDVAFRNSATVTTWSRFGFTAGSVVTGTDVKYIDNVVVRNDLGEAAPQPGDHNQDGKVDAADYVVWRKNPAGFDANAYDIWRANFGLPAGSGAAFKAGAVPEPSAVALAGFVLIGMFLARRRQ